LRSIRYAPFDPHSLNPFRNPTAAYLYGSQVTATAPFFGLPDASLLTCHVTATVKHENPAQRNPSIHPGKLLKPPHFLLATGVRYLYAHLLPVGHKRKPQACGIGQFYHLSTFILIIPSLLPRQYLFTGNVFLIFKGIAVSFILPHAALFRHI
jgi:hypothetical protein